MIGLFSFCDKRETKPAIELNSAPNTPENYISCKINSQKLYYSTSTANAHEVKEPWQKLYITSFDEKVG